MTKKEAMKLFEDRKVRAVWDDEKEEWYFSVVDVVGVLTDSENPQVYWRVLKKRLKSEGNETVTNCNSLKMRAPDGKMRLTDVGKKQVTIYCLIKKRNNKIIVSALGSPPGAECYLRRERVFTTGPL